MQSTEQLLRQQAQEAYDENGVDRSPIRAHLQLTPEQRLTQLENLLRDLAQVRRAASFLTSRT